MTGGALELQKEYALRFEPHREYRQRVWQVLCSHFFARLIPPDARVLDLGAGWGEFINNIVAAERLAMDLNPETASRLAEGVRCLQHDVSLPWPLPDGSLDVVFTSNFLEHLPDKGKVQLAVTEAHRCLRSGGRLICLGPNIRFLPGAYWDFWDHHVPLSDRTICELLQLTGFSIERSVPRFLPYSMSQSSVQPPLALLRLYLAWPLAWRLLGKQFLVIGRKP